MILGRRDVGGGVQALGADTITLYDLGLGDLVDDVVVGSLIARLDGLGPGNGEQVIRPVVAEADDVGATISYGDEIAVEDGQAAAWLHLTFAEPPRLRAGHMPLLGLAAGQADQLAQLAGDAQAGAGQRWPAVYPTPPDTSLVAAVPGWRPSLVLVGVAPWRPPDTLTDEQLAALPFDVAQALFTGGPVAAPFGAVAGWHYDHEDPPPPATAIARTDGPIAPLVGQRLRVSAGGRSVIVYVDDEEPFDDDLADEDLSLSRVAFMRLAPLWTTSLPVTVEVLA